MSDKTITPKHDSAVVRLSARAIIALCMGQTDPIMAELIEKLDGMARQIGATVTEQADRAPLLCPQHRAVLTPRATTDAFGDKKTVWVCPVLGCGAEFRWGDDIDSQAAAIMAQEITEKRREGGGKGSHGSGGRKRRKKNQSRRRFFCERY